MAMITYGEKLAKLLEEEQASKPEVLRMGEMFDTLFNDICRQIDADLVPPHVTCTDEQFRFVKSCKEKYPAEYAAKKDMFTRSRLRIVYKIFPQDVEISVEPF